MSGDIAWSADDSGGDGVADGDGDAETYAENLKEFSALFTLGLLWRGLKGRGVRSGRQSWLGGRRHHTSGGENCKREGGCGGNDVVTAGSAHFGDSNGSFAEEFQVQLR